MPIIELKGLKIEVDHEDYLVDFESWNEDVARALAEKEGIKELSREMMDILHFFREYYKKHNIFPILSTVCRNVHQPQRCVFEQFMDPLKAWRIAGLPKPAGEIMAYLSGTMK